MKTAYFRFYEELNDFLPKEKKKRRFSHSFIDRTSIKDMIESLGVPHTEIDLILVNRKTVNFNYLVEDEDDVSVYPVFESFDISDVQHLRAEPLREPKFILDVHLGKLAKYMRMLGLDTLYENNYEDDEIVKISIIEKRTILTKDLGILKRNEVTHGYWVRDTNPDKQILEIIERFDLKNILKELSLCLECNTPLVMVEKEKVLSKIPIKARKFHNDFYECPSCKKIFWKGSHYIKMKKIINDIIINSTKTVDNGLTQ
jgi:uncharacterized protein with PIN domain